MALNFWVPPSWSKIDFKSILSLFLDFRPFKLSDDIKKILLTSTRKGTELLVEPNKNFDFKVRPYGKLLQSVQLGKALALIPSPKSVVSGLLSLVSSL